MKTLLAYTKSNSGSPYAYYKLEGEVVSGSRTATTVKVKFKLSAHLDKAASKVPSGHPINAEVDIKGGVGDNLAYLVVSGGGQWTGNAVRTVTKTVTVLGLTVNTKTLQMTFRVDDDMGSYVELSKRAVASLSIPAPGDAWKSANLKMTGSGVTTKQAVGTVTGIPKCSYPVTVKWYRGNTLVQTGTIGKNSGITSINRTYTGLTPSSSYTLTAKFYYEGNLLASVGAGISTPAETLTLGATARKTSIDAKLTGMTAAPNYSRTVKIYYKKHADSEYKLAVTKTGVSTASLTYSITKLLAGTKYDIKACIYNGTSLLVTRTTTVTTPADTVVPVEDMCPTPYFGRINPVLKADGRTDRAYMRVQYKADEWIAGMIQKMYVKINDGAYTELSLTQEGKDCEDVFTLTFPVGDTEMDVKFKYEIKFGSNTNEVYSSTYTLVAHFAWDTAKVQGQQCVITANEWNRLCDYVEYVGDALEVGVDLNHVSQGDPISADVYNAVNSQIYSVIGEKTARTAGYSIKHKETGDAIKADDIDMLRTGINAAVGG